MDKLTFLDELLDTLLLRFVKDNSEGPGLHVCFGAMCARHKAPPKIFFRTAW